MEPITCPCCLGISFDVLIDFGVVPRSGTFLTEPAQAFPPLRLKYEFCSDCGLVRCQTSEDPVREYAYIERSTGHWIPQYCEEIADSLHERGIENDALIIDIGANDGAFLDVLAGKGFTNCLGVEPSVACGAICRAKGHQVENVYLDQKEARRIHAERGPARVVFCRHTLEHVPDPPGLLRAIRSLLCENGILFIEVPNVLGITQRLRVHELWDEHLYHFTPETLSLLVCRCGFRVETTSAKVHRGLTNILLWCISARAENEKLILPETSSLDVQLCRTLYQRWKFYSGKLLMDLPNWPRPIACIGASHPQTNFLLFTGLGRHTALLVDDDPAKVGRYVPAPEPLPVVSTARFLEGKPPGTVIRAAFGYEDWMNRLLESFAAVGVRMINPYEEAASERINEQLRL